MKRNRFATGIYPLFLFPAAVSDKLPYSISPDSKLPVTKTKINRFYFYIIAILCLPIAFSLTGLTQNFPPLHPDNFNFFSNSRLAAAPAPAIRDDTPAIQKMIDQAPSGGKIVIPPGVYNINKNPKFIVYTDYGKSYSALKITKPITIVMDNVTFKTATAYEYGVFWIYNTSNVHLKGGSLIGNAMPMDGHYMTRVAVLVQKSKDCLIEDMATKNFSQGVNLYKSDKCTVKHIVTESNSGSGIISMQSKNSIIDSNIIRNSGDGHLSLYGGGEYNTVSNNTVSENRVNKSDQQGITVEAEKNSLIKGNTVTGFYYGIDIKNGSRYCNITQNTTTNNRYNIALRTGDPNSKLQPSHGIIIFKNNAMNPRKGKPNAGIYVSYAGGGHIIQGNTTNEGKLIYGSTVVEEDMRNKFVNFIGNILK